MTSTSQLLQIDPEFESKIPPLTEDEYRQLEDNILSEGAVLMPLIVWNGIIVDGHNRYKIVRENPHIPFTVHEKVFENRYEALSWICRNQLGRRNLTSIQKKMLIGDRYEAEKMAHGASEGFQGNQHIKLVCGQNDHTPESGKTRKRIAAETGTSESYVKRAGQFSQGATAAEEVSPGFRQEVLSGKVKPTQREMQMIAKAEPEERRSIMDKIFCPGTVKADKESSALIKKISEDMAKEKPGMTPQKAVKQFEWKITRVLQDFDDTFDQWPQLISDEIYRNQVTATLQDLKNYILQIEGGKRYEWDRDARKIIS
ncbi:hypothetical protein [Acutalibacter intestini]|uniref:hypothetical protein n=1 Tax=Acutalibacter intestini TaxID=3093659 RepID=UPI002AC95DB3|nr:hypothetical protein [Acutalibacter sp. M00204]